MKRNTCIIFSLFIIGHIYAQQDFRKGYIITNENDTVYGWIDYRGDIRNAMKCSFKKTKKDKVIDFSPLDIASYRFIDSKYYVSKNIGSHENPNQVFLECLVDGLAKLYYYRDNRLNNYYYIEKEGKMLELKNEEKNEYNDGRIYIKQTKPYIGVLKATLNVWEMNNEIDNAQLDHSSLSNIVRDYHYYACTDGSDCIVYKKKKMVKPLRFGPVVGTEMSNIRIINKNKFIETYNYNQSTNLTIGASLNFSLQQIDEKLFIQIQALYTKHYYFVVYERSNLWTDSHILNDVMEFGFSFKYEYPKSKLRPTLAVGPSAVYLPGAKIENNKDHYVSTSVVHAIDEKIDFPTKFMYGFEIIPGVHYHLNNEWIIFVQLHYMKNYKRQFPNMPNNYFRSFGVSTGIYF